jgi:signal transduction histidine kinase
MNRHPSFRNSVFAKLLAIMLTMAISLLLLVSGFFAWAIVPALNRALDPFFDDFVHVVAGAQPSFEQAKQLADRLELQIRYEGPDGAWTTSDRLPPMEKVRTGGGTGPIGGSSYRLVPAPNGGTYLFRWTFQETTLGVHYALLVLLLVLMAVAIVAAHMTITRLLRPLRQLGEGVEQISAGQLDVTLPAPTSDEFGTLVDAFNVMVGRVREMIRARDQLLLDVSHELRSPLTRVRVAVELLPEGADRDRLAADVMEMDAMIAELLELERLRNGRGIHPARQNLASIVREVATGFENRPPGVRIIALPREILVDVDGETMRTVLRNLLENAIKYSLPDSSAVEVSAACDAQNVVLRITDDGPGIPDEERVSIFEPFFRLNRSRSKTPTGYGLGLSICKRIIEAHGGSIAVENGASRGAVFEVTLPLPELERERSHRDRT